MTDEGKPEAQKESRILSATMAVFALAFFALIGVIVVLALFDVIL